MNSLMCCQSGFKKKKKKNDIFGKYLGNLMYDDLHAQLSATKITSEVLSRESLSQIVSL